MQRLLVILTLRLADQMLACPHHYGCPRLLHPHRHPALNHTHRSMRWRCREIPPLLGMHHLLSYPKPEDRVYRASTTHPSLPEPAAAQMPPQCTAISSQIASSHLNRGPMAQALSLLPSSRARPTCARSRYRQQTPANVIRNNSRRMIRLQRKCGRCTHGPRPTCRMRSAWRT